MIDVRDAIRAGQFDAARDTVGVRGGTLPLTRSKSMLATPIAGQPGRSRAQLLVDVASEAGQGVQYKFKVERVFENDPGLPPPQRTGHIERLGRPASAIVSPREVQVWLPPSHGAEPLGRFPVLYVHDDQSFFDKHAAGAKWQVDEAAQKLVLSDAVQPMILYASAQTGKARP